MSKLDLLKQLAAEYPAPWKYDQGIGAILGPDWHAVVSQSDEEGEFIAEMRNVLPKLLALVEVGKWMRREISNIDCHKQMDDAAEAWDKLMAEL